MQLNPMEERLWGGIGPVGARQGGLLDHSVRQAALALMDPASSMNRMSYQALYMVLALTAGASNTWQHHSEAVKRGENNMLII